MSKTSGKVWEFDEDWKVTTLYVESIGVTSSQ